MASAGLREGQRRAISDCVVDQFRDAFQFLSRKLESGWPYRCAANSGARFGQLNYLDEFRDGVERGSLTTPLRNPSCSRANLTRRAANGPFPRSGPTEMTVLMGSPQVCESTTCTLLEFINVLDRA